MSPIRPAIRFEADGYDPNAGKLMGRQMAGHGFLRAAIAAHAGEPLTGFGPNAASAQAFDALVRGLDPAASTRWLQADQLEALGANRVAYLPHPGIGAEARLRLRVGIARHSLVGVTHTLSSAHVMETLSAMMREPIAPWDALICTSQAGRDVIDRLLDADADYLRWRFGPTVELQRPELPIIPLGVHTKDFDALPPRAEARQALGLADDEVAALFVGRLVFSGKAHPAQMYQGLQAAAERTGRKVALVQFGQATNDFMAKAYASGAELLCPDVRLIGVDGQGFEGWRRVWAGADLFLSLSDNIQETFGLTPVEAMAAGLPVVVSDWNGYRDTVRDGVDGFRIPTWTPAAGQGEHLGRLQETGGLSYDRYIWAAAAMTSMDAAAVADRLSALVDSADLRRTMGEAGRRRARELYDWAQVYARYEALFAELDARRLAVQQEPETLARFGAAPRATPGRIDPLTAFAGYPTHALGAETRVALAPGATREAFRALSEHDLFTGARVPTHLAEPIWAALEAHGPLTVADLARTTTLHGALTLRAAATLAKMGLVTLS